MLWSRAFSRKPISPGTVTWQSRSAGDTVQEKTKINLIISSGPAETPPPEEEEEGEEEVPPEQQQEEEQPPQEGDDSVG